jgi:hypothetical protein
VHRTVRSSPPAGGGGRRAGEFFGALGAAWPLTAAQRSRLAPAVLAALNAGWTPHELARFAGANAGGVRNPYAVLAVRLSAAELPPAAPANRPPRLPWCGDCDERTRMAGFYSDAPHPCPRCKPTARAQQRSPSPNSPHRLPGGPAQQASIGARAAQRRAHPVHRNDAPGATFDPAPDRSVHAGNDHPGR